MTPCWPAAVDCDDCLSSISDGRRALLEEMAATILWNATGQQYGGCPTTYRPCAKECGEFWGGLPTPVRLDGEWINVACGACTGACGCDVVSEVVIPNTAAVLAINIDGQELLPEDTVVVYDNRRIVRVDGGAWPRCQNLSTPTGEAGAWSITVQPGPVAPSGADVVLGMLVCELAKACAGDDDCRLPRRIQTITRNGVTVGFQDQFDNLADLRTGIFEIDLWIESARSTRWRRGRVRSPDVPRASVQTWPLYDEPVSL